MKLDTRIAHELLDVLLVTDPARDELQAEEVAVERDRALEIGDLDPEVVDAVEVARDEAATSATVLPE